MPKAAKADGLVGKMFHSFTPEGKVCWQGRIAGNPEPGWYLLELFSWITGMETHQVLVQIEDMTNFHFYDDAEWMNTAYREDIATTDKEAK